MAKRFLVTFSKEERRLIDSVKGRTPFATWVRERAVSAAQHFANTRKNTPTTPTHTHNPDDQRTDWD